MCAKVTLHLRFITTIKQRLTCLNGYCTISIKIKQALYTMKSTHSERLDIVCLFISVSSNQELIYSPQDLIIAEFIKER